MKPKFQFLLWLNTLVFCVYLSAHLFDIFILIPNWRSGTMEDIQLYNAFFHQTNPYDFYKVIMPVSTVLSFSCFIAYAHRGNPMLVFLLIALLIDIGIDLVTWSFFLPINEYLFFEQGGDLQPDRVREYVRSWVTADYLRTGLIVIGFYASLLALHYSYRSR
jgi:hypothetical protein